MREITYLVLLALLFISGEARPADEVGDQPVSLQPAFAASNGTEVKTPRRFVAEGYGKRSVPDEGDAAEDPESEVDVGPPGGDTAVKEAKEGDQQVNEEGEETARDEERETEGEVSEATEENKPKISFSRDRRSPQNKDSTAEVNNDKSSEEDTSDNTTAVIPIRRPQRPLSLRGSEGGAAENEKKPVIEGKEPTDVTTDTEEDNTSSKSKRSPQTKDDRPTSEDDNERTSEDDTRDGSTSSIPVRTPLRPVSHRVNADGVSRKEETPGTEGKDKTEKEATDETTDSAEDTSSSRSKRHPQSRDGPGEADNDKSSEEDEREETPAIASSPNVSAIRPVLRRPTEGVLQEERVTAGNDKQEGKQDKESDEGTSDSTGETNTKTTLSRNKRSPQTSDGNNKSPKDTNEATTAAPTSVRTPRPAPRRVTTAGGVTGKAVTPERHTPTPASKIPTPTPASKTPTHTPIIRRPTPAHATNGPSN